MNYFRSVLEKSSFLVGLAGGSATGKTTFIKALQEVFDEGQLCIISQDHYYKALSEQVRDQHGVVNFDHPDGIDFNRLRKDIRTLQKGKQVRIVEYTFNNPNIFPKEIVFNPAPITVVEGLFVYANKALYRMFDYRMYIHADDQLTLKRRLVRDATERGMTEEEVMYQWDNHVIPAYEQFLRPHRQSAHFEIQNNQNFDEALHQVVDIFNEVLSARKP